MIKNNIRQTIIRTTIHLMKKYIRILIGRKMTHFRLEYYLHNFLKKIKYSQVHLLLPFRYLFYIYFIKYLIEFHQFLKTTKFLTVFGCPSTEEIT
jgi:hypothetical protein